MTDKTEQQNHLDDTKKPTSEQENTEKVSGEAITTKSSTPPSTKQSRQKQEKKSTGFLSYLAIFLSLGALGVSGWQFYQDYLNQGSTQLVDLETSQKHLSKQFAVQKNATANLQPALKQLSSQLSNTITPKLTELDKLTQDTNTRFTFDINLIKQKLNRLENTTKEDWKLAEAEYLIRLANQRLLMEQDILGASKMLISADNILVQLDDPLLFSVRKTLASDIQKLNATTHFDIEGLYLQLEALVTQVKALPQKGHIRHTEIESEPVTTESQPVTTESEPVTTESQPVTTESEPVTVEKDLLDELWSTLKSLVIINYNSKPIKPLLPPTEYQQLVLNIQLQANVAQLALLKQENTIYQTALKHIIDLTNEHFDANSKATGTFLSSIATLQNYDIAPNLPLPRDSLVAIKAAAKEWRITLNEESTLNEDSTLDKNDNQETNTTETK